MHIVTDRNHSTLGIIDRFIRTLRDMNTLTEISKHESHDEKYTFITPKRMKKYLNTYNSTYHTAISCTLNEMMKDPEREKRYIFRCLEAAENQHQIKDLILPLGAYVRYILTRHDGITKKRYQISRECYKIDERKVNMYSLIAQDGTVMSIPRLKLILCSSDGSKPSNIKYISTIPGKWNGNVEKISSFN
ncbi:Integrase core domain containing protein [Histomonas meleagridis]|nr:Integrase core domain containing protein [Histomonas meleagridis]